MAPSVAQDTPDEKELHRISELKIQKAYNADQHSSVCKQPIDERNTLLTPKKYPYKAYLPVHDETTTFPPTEPFEFSDRGLLADKAKPHLFGAENTTITKLTPRVGSEITGLQLSQLTDVQKNELALLIAERGVVVFRDQDFKDIGVEKQKEFGQYFGRLHVHVSRKKQRAIQNCADK